MKGQSGQFQAQRNGGSYCLYITQLYVNKTVLKFLIIYLNTVLQMNTQKIISWVPIIFKSIQIPFIVLCILSGCTSFIDQNFSTASQIFLIFTITFLFSECIVIEIIIRKYKHFLKKTQPQIIRKRKQLSIQLILTIVLMLNFILIQVNIFKKSSLGSALYSFNLFILAIITVRCIIGIVTQIMQDKENQNNLQSQLAEKRRQEYHMQQGYNNNNIQVHEIHVSNDSNTKKTIALTVPPMNSYNQKNQYQNFEDQLVEI